MTYLVPATTGLTTRIGVPTLRIIGERDHVICNPHPAHSSGWTRTPRHCSPPESRLTPQPGAGHNIALECGNTSGVAGPCRAWNAGSALGESGRGYKAQSHGACRPILLPDLLPDLPVGNATERHETASAPDKTAGEGHLRIRRLGVRVPPSALSITAGQGRFRGP